MNGIALDLTPAATTAAPADLPSGFGFDQPSAELLTDVLRRQRATYRAAPLPSAAERRDRLRRLLKALLAHQDAICAATSADFGGRSPTESRIADVLGVVLNIRHAISHVKRWMKPERRGVELLFLPNTARVEHQPKGVVGIVVPWNFPAYLSLGPLVAALAAGNRAMIKMSEYTPATTAALRTMLAEAFATDEVAVFGGDVTVAEAFSGLAFDHLIFTGSPGVGRRVMAAAAKNLTPVTLELGGKSPAIVSRSAKITDAAARITHGKSFNCGQICIAPDYALVPREMVGAFVEAVRAHFRRMYPTGCVGNAEYTSVVTPSHAARIHRLIRDARDKGATVIACEEGASGPRIPLHLVLAPTPDMAVMQEEIFGPVLPVVAYDTIDEAITHVVERDRPLALYWFGHDDGECRRVLDATHSGGVTLNDWGWHAMQSDLPFGGIGNAGTGSYHGVEGFRSLSHSRAVFRERPWFPIGLFHPPYGNVVQKLSVSLFLGRRK